MVLLFLAGVLNIFDRQIVNILAQSIKTDLGLSDAQLGLLTGTAFSVSAAIGFIALFGIAVMEGIILLSYFNQLIDGGAVRAAAIMQACQTRFRPVMMTCIAACVGLLPAALSTAIGAQVQRPLALVVVGGILLTPILVLIILPVLIDVFSRKTRPEVLVEGATEPAE